jgi:hypothetical protein
MRIMPLDSGTLMLIKFKKVFCLEKELTGIKLDINTDGVMIPLPKLVTP